MNTSYYQNRILKKYKFENLDFKITFLSFFGFKDNKYKEFKKYLSQRSDFDALRSDWISVGEDFNRVIEINKITLHATEQNKKEEISSDK